MTDQARETKEVEIDLKKLLCAYLKRWWLIVICTLLVAGGAYVYAAYFTVPQYQASVTIYVNNSTSATPVDYVSESSLSAAERLVTTYITMVRSNTVLNKVAENLGPNYTANYINYVMTAQQVEETELFRISISTPHPEESARIANAIASVAPSQIEEFIDGSSTQIIDYATVPMGPYYPNYTRFLQFGAIIGFLLALGIITLIYLLDKRVRHEEELEQLFTKPVLATIPIFSDSSQADIYKSNYPGVSG